jgi:hypothetical protein
LIDHPQYCSFILGYLTACYIASSRRPLVLEILHQWPLLPFHLLAS